jgi:hypothetical protein
MTALCRPAGRYLLATLPYSLCATAPADTRAGLRSDPDDVRVLVFTAAPLSLEIEVMSGRAVGQILPPGPGEIRVEASDGATFQVEADEAGFFDLTGLPSGPVRLRCDTPNGRLVTDWVQL